MVNANEILELVKSRRYRPMRMAELARRFQIENDEWDSFEKLLMHLQLQGLVVVAKGNRICLPEEVDLLVGTLDVTRDGDGYVIPKVEDGLGDVHIVKEDLGTAFHGDTVLVRLEETKGRGRRQHRRRGTIIRVLQRANLTVVGTFQRGTRFAYCVPDDPRVHQDVYIAEEDTLDAVPGEKVVVGLFEWNDAHRNPEGQVVERLGREDKPGVDFRVVVRQYGLREKFGHKAVTEAKSFGDSVAPESLKGRLDLRGMTLITIDPETAHDFDDAVSLEELPDGGWKLGVHIADVSHYVKEGSALDEEAQVRGTSVYLPGAVHPMLPEQLSSHLCSLREGEDRLTKSVFIEFGTRGAVRRFDIHKSVICSARRLHYLQAAEMLDASDDSDPLVPLLKKMEKLARFLFQHRMAQGALDLDIPETDLKLNEAGEVIGMQRQERLWSHRIIEEFMLAANQAVAEYSRQHRLPCMYRVHENPEDGKMDDFREFILAWGYSLPKHVDRMALQEFLKSIQGRAESYPISIQLLRSFMHAAYSARVSPHFALGLARYCHFTSPIRRYPDLLVHRVLDAHFEGELRGEPERRKVQHRLEDLQDHCSQTERKAEEAERDLTKLKLLHYLQQRSEEVFHAVIVDVRHFGFFVELEESLLQGLVHVSRLTDDYYHHDTRRHCYRGRTTQKVYSLGDRLQVRVEKVDLVKHQVDFVPVV